MLLVNGRGKILGQFEPQTPLTWPVETLTTYLGNLASVLEILDSPVEFLSASQFHCNWTISFGSNWSYDLHHCIRAIIPKAKIEWVGNSTFQPPPIQLTSESAHMCQTHVSGPLKVAKVLDLLISRSNWTAPICSMTTITLDCLAF